MLKNSSRNANMELLRIISMIMVTMLHALAKSDLLPTFVMDVSFNGWIAWILEVLSIGAVNIFMLISGYFLVNSEFKLKRLIELILQTFLYSAVPFVVFLASGKLGPEDRGIYQLLNNFLPIHMDTYWFITAYVVVYMLSPIITKGLKAVTKKQLITVIVCLLIYECVLKSILPFRLTTDTKGYSFLWYIIMFLIGAYFRLFGFRFLDKQYKGWVLYLGGSALVLLGTFAIGRIIAATDRLNGLQGLFTEYNHVFALISAVGIFTAFVHMKPIEGIAAKIICILSPMALGVYLLQESLVLRFEWQKWFGLPGALELSTPIFLLKVFAAVLGMYALGTAVDAVRKVIFKFAPMPVEKLIKQKKDSLDGEKPSGDMTE
ncbi:MAG: acyltransferase [Lachnospiraceae bacterium]|nr:acyltransferase [Lachnospiraceae bacterium]